jgi:cytochrome c oxidase cbb3-type subunit 2
MKKEGIGLFIGLLAALLFSVWGMIIMPLKTFGHQEPVLLEETGKDFPSQRPGTAAQGRDVYRSQGCAACHTQQVQPEGLSPDVARGWGKRRSVARDYLFESPQMIGTLRIGPDLSNFGARLVEETPEATAENLEQVFLHLYNPRYVRPESTMPGYSFLFDDTKTTDSLGTGALTLADGKSVKTGYSVVPSSDAKALVAYLQSLNIEASLYEAPIPIE